MTDYMLESGDLRVGGKFALTKFDGEIEWGSGWFEATFVENTNRPLLPDVGVRGTPLAGAYARMFILPGGGVSSEITLGDSGLWVLTRYRLTANDGRAVLVLRYERDWAMGSREPEVPQTVVLEGLQEAAGGS